MLIGRPKPPFVPTAPRSLECWPMLPCLFPMKVSSVGSSACFFFSPKQSGAYFILVSELNLFLFIVVSNIFYLNLTIFFSAYSFSYCLN